ncbi:MAG: hypothetical protein QOF42_516 [Gammaproteobacteria bacterium]|jgi:hypothetical protein|nr:hypothetical protein [Gammaproteobacteria bacterium]
MTLFLCALIGIYALQQRGNVRVRELLTPAAAVLIVLALFLVLEPETRALLMLVDYLGIDLMVTVAALYLRQHLVITASLILIPLLRIAYRYGPVPGFWPYRQIMRSGAMWPAYAVLCPLVVATFGGVLIACLLRPLF